MSSYTPMLLFGTMIALFLIAGGIWYQSFNIIPVGLDAIEEAENLVQDKEKSFNNIIQDVEHTVNNAVQKQQGGTVEPKVSNTSDTSGSGISCIDSDTDKQPNPIYFKGTVTVAYDGGSDVTVGDECVDSFLKLNEYWCKESPQGSGRYSVGQTKYDCPKGCFDGACVR